jgi:hypothetical protein
MRYLIILLFLASCRAPETIRDNARAQKYVEKIKELDPSVLTTTVDTVYSEYIFTDTVYLRSILRDTLFQYLPGDTVFIQSEGTTARVIFLPGNQASLSLTRPKTPVVFNDTLVLPTAINQTIQVQERPFWTWLNQTWNKLGFATLILFLLFIVLFVARFLPKL